MRKIIDMKEFIIDKNLNIENLIQMKNNNVQYPYF